MTFAFLALALAAWATATVPSALADGCTDPQSATVLEAGTPVQGSLQSSTSVNQYVFEVTEPDTLVTVTITDPYERLYPYLDSSCEIDEGGGGRHLDGGDWSRVGNAWVVSFDAGVHVGDYYVTITSDVSNTVFPASYVVGVALEE